MAQQATSGLFGQLVVNFDNMFGDDNSPPLSPAHPVVPQAGARYQRASLSTGVSNLLHMTHASLWTEGGLEDSSPKSGRMQDPIQEEIVHWSACGLLLFLALCLVTALGTKIVFEEIGHMAGALSY